MPAVTVENPLTLPRLPQPLGAVREREVLAVTTAPSGFEGEGFPVRKALATIKPQYLDPFIMMDQMGEVDYAPGEPKGTPWHPHRGFETVTYMIDGVMDHADSHGGGGTISDGDTQWMTAGGGILHKEAPPEWLVQKGGLFHGIQLWVNLPGSQKMVAPNYQDIGRSNVVLLSSHDGGALVRLIAGEVAGFTGPGSTRTPITLLHASLSPGSRLTLPWRKDFNALAYVLSGRGGVGADRQPIESGQLAVFDGFGAVPGLGTEGEGLTLWASGSQESRSPNLEVIVLGGRPIGEPVAHYGPFVMNTQEELAKAFEDYQAGRLGTIPAGHA
ncbi:pirin family protein [Streptosporangium roseum]|uniref:Pirin domain-containing protein n=1 Tax=Streptosporangium roseum (strain ATCC 12428 / DSM 43021 / JCM 3005 / KCTC 9067 / NCIMB 10171 / NRRL 2505 / NI 9100) TaxID=479432 RepID=D2ARM0_STRRD|nr:pirin family protein [Streptosporangium roseum]ACZ90360.1 pirin domain-containing protein [Streptosporangium roseum DSM 43021]